METVVRPAAPSPIIFPVELSTEVPDPHFQDGWRARWYQPEIADANGRGVAEVLDQAGANIVWQRYADTVTDAREWLAGIDWNELASDDDERDNCPHFDASGRAL